MSRATIEELRDEQTRRGWGFIHMVAVDERGFTIAHTDAERHKAAHGGPPLEQCAIHKWMLDRGRGDEAPGLYVFVKRMPDGVSESFRSDAEPWDLVPADKAHPRPPQVFACRR